ncbi:ATP-binding protein [Massilia sp. CF038]|uniref:hybrid sensor histidine kinase/response regulator n=1 Tax=Massilia sp. CF038 TaxID=1881045 RepID=UPI00091F1CB0|nr:ATP-binding protein [Massilia sp. CF038]SHH52079.1 PAS domain S-box-containing protein [Massilia sp. CF038]
MRHKKLVRQVRRAFGVESEQALQDMLGQIAAGGHAPLAHGIASLLVSIQRSYEEYDRDLQVRTRMLEISSEELLSANAQLRAEGARQRQVLQSLQSSVQRLTFDAGGTPEPAPADADHDLLGLTHALEKLVQQRETARELTEQILDQLPIPVFLKDREGRFVRFNRQFQQFYQLTREQLMGARIEDFTPPAWASVTQQEDTLAWRTGLMVSSERRVTQIDPPVDLVVNRIVIHSGGESYLLGFSIDISEQRAARDAMQRAVESAQAASRAKSEFLANMSHEIRTPMNGILGMTELVLESPLAPEQRDDIALVKASADALLTIVNEILDFSKIEAGKLDLEEVPFDLRQLVRETIRSLTPRAQKKGLQLSCDMPPQIPRMMKGDPGRLRQVLLNLLGNAIKFTQQGSVTLDLVQGFETEDRCEIEFIVTDTGIGIPLEKQQMIFEPFAQVDGSTTRQFGGTGLGLTICRRLVILMQGDIAVDSAPGKGSAFRFSVPLRHATQDPMARSVLAAPDAPVAPDLVLSALPQVQAPDSGGSGLRILLAEDNPVNQRLALRLLEKMGHRITLVDNGQDALARTMQGGFDLILMDVQMPELDGLSAARRIRQWELAHGGHVPIVAMTARAMQGDRERCLEAGMDDYLSKPIDSEHLRQLVSRFHVEQAGPVLAWRAALLRLDGDTGLLLELAALFIDDGPQLMQTLYQALAADDLPASQRAVHSLQGVLVNFGAQRAISQAERLSTSLHEPAQAAQWRGQAQELGGAVDEVYAALHALIAAGPEAMGK